MRTFYYLIIILAAGTLATSCRKSDFAHEDRYKKSYQAWLRFKQSSGDSYQYVVRSSSWTGASSETVITVEAGVVVQRKYELSVMDPDTHQPYSPEQWTEDADSVNTHSAGARGLTLDEVYQQARDLWLQKRKDAKIYFEAGNNGLISSCGYVPKGCVDDCFRGINIPSIEAL